MKVSVYIATTLDGYIAREDGALDWLPGSDGTVQEGLENEDFGFNAFFSSVDTMIMGRNTFEFVSASQPWFYKDKQVIILSSTLKTLPSHLPKNVSISCVSPTSLIAQLKNAGSKHIYIDGGKTIQSFVNAGLINEMIITTVPILIGRGIPLFDNLNQDIQLQLLGSQSFKNSFIQNTYKLETTPQC